MIDWKVEGRGEDGSRGGKLSILKLSFGGPKDGTWRLIDF